MGRYDGAKMHTSLNKDIAKKQACCRLRMEIPDAVLKVRLSQKVSNVFVLP
jgi:hypothetical protein